MRRRNWISGGLALVLTLSLAGCSLAQPEPAGPERDEFIGYYLIYGSQGEVYENLVDEHWTEYGSENLDLGAYGSVSSPRMILAAEEPEEGEYVFPGLDGLSFFFPICRRDRLQLGGDRLLRPAGGRRGLGRLAGPGGAADGGRDRLSHGRRKQL